MLLGGLWHGANLTYVLWGALHGLMVTVEKRFNLFKKGPFRSLLVFFIVSVLWLPFRAKNMHHLKTIIEHIGHTALNLRQLPEVLLQQFGSAKSFVLALVFMVFILIERKINTANFNIWVEKFRSPVRLGVYYLLLIVILLLINFDVKPYFIYFQF